MLTASILAFIEGFYGFDLKSNVHISNELNFSVVYRRVNYAGLQA